ncbi:MAG: TIGR04283 family arsenosugar biosynthesis glycosyltransferase, partial [Pseudomonadaceae bacterium]
SKNTAIPSSPTVIPAQAGIQTDVQQAKEPNRKHSARPHPTMDPRLREDDVGGECEVFSPGSSLSKSTVIPAQAGIQADGQHAQEPNRKHSAHPHQTMDPRLREDDVGVGTVIPAHAGIHFDLGVQSLWGRFDVRLAPSSPTLRLVAWMMNQRSRLTGICTGDQAIFVRRDLFNRLGGYAAIPLMEDIELSKRLKRISPPACIRQPLTTSSRRWQTRGVLRTIVLMWWLRLQYWAGVSPAKLVKKYYPARPSSE